MEQVFKNYTINRWSLIIIQAAKVYNNMTNVSNRALLERIRLICIFAIVPNAERFLCNKLYIWTEWL
jgi:hypothetical protein